mmetsp:Transcript_13440/g.31546  ORF Transcript_13440/g.31546 Transcript_13440/m.31546 type:complete len:1359 (-) Transcript_13440:179-4255(-)
MVKKEEKDSKAALFTIDGKQHGNGAVLMAWQGAGNYLATVGPNRQVQICDRYGQVVDDVSLTAGGQVLALDWDADGETLAVLQQNNSALILWDAVQKKTSMLETNTKDLSWMKWSKTGAELAVGSGKGNLVIYNKRTTRLNPLLGKHSKRITCGNWNDQNQLALGSDDKTISISTNTGEFVRQETVRAEPGEVFLSDAAKGKVTLSAAVGKKSVFIMFIGTNEPPLDLQFVPKYGDVVAHRWAAEDEVLIGFSSGIVIGLSANEKSQGKEVFKKQLFRGGVTGLEVCPSFKKAAVCGENSVRFVDTADWKELPDETIELPTNVSKVKWTEDGNVLSVATADGSVSSYLASMPVLNAANGTAIVFMSSLREVQVKDARDLNKKPLCIGMKSEPSFIALGGQHVGMGVNNLCWFYTRDKSATMVNECEYLASVDHVSMNSTKAAVQYEGSVQLHDIEGDPEGRNTKTFPDTQDDSGVSSAHLTEQFLIYSTVMGSIVYYSLEDGTRPNEYRHVEGIKKIYPSPTGMRLVVVDNNMTGYVYNPVDSTMLEIKNFPHDAENLLWDMKDANVFVVIGKSEATTFRYRPVGLRGQSAEVVPGPSADNKNTKRPSAFSAMVLHGGEVTFQASNGMMQTLTLASHSALARIPEGGSTDEIKFQQAIAIGRLDQAYEIALDLETAEAWAALRMAALESLDVQTAIKVGRQTKDASTVLALQRLVTAEDKNLLAGSIALLLRDYSLAQDLLLASARPVTALEMRCDLMQWDQAMRLAETLAPLQIPHICLQYAEQLQAKGEYEMALERYQKAMQDSVMTGGKTVKVEVSEEHKQQCQSGMARMYVKTGNSVKGMQLASECGEVVCRDCGQILESIKQYTDAALMYEKGGAFDKAAGLYIKLKDFKAAKPLMDKVATPKLHVRYAQAKEKSGQFKEAADAYEKGKDMDSVVRLCLEQLQSPQRAFSIVRETRSYTGASEIVKYCTRNGEIRSAIEFMIIAKDNQEARQLAESHDLMDAFALFLGTEGTQGEYVSMAQYYENKQQFETAAELLEKAGQYQKALKLFLQVGEKALDKAIDLVGSVRNEMLTHTLVDYLMGEHDRIVKDPNYIFRLYMALGNYRQAARTAVIIARQEQEMGNYKVAHKMLFDTYKDLDSQNIPVPRELEDSLMLLHSYVLVKALVKQGDHATGARMLCRVANSISKFPAHIVPILTSTVIECQRAGLKKTSFEYASMLMRPEYRPQIAETYKKKIESIVRKPTKVEEDEPVSSCPYCAEKSPESVLDCPHCNNRIPYCIATGLKMTANDWCVCPSCRFPALHSRFPALIESEKNCPMCEQEVVPSAISKIDDVKELLKKAAKQVDEGKDEKA